MTRGERCLLWLAVGASWVATAGMVGLFVYRSEAVARIGAWAVLVMLAALVVCTILRRRHA